MALGRIRHIPNLPPEAARVLVERINALTDEVSALRRPPPVTGLKNDGHFATEGSVVRLRGGQRVALPRARAENAGTSIVVIVEVAGAISITAHRGFVNGARVQTLSDVGAYEFFSNGVDGWYLQGSLPGTSSGASALDAEYLVGASHTSLPSARVATDSAEIDADLTVANVASWALRTASVAFSKLADLTGLSVLGRAANSAGVMAAITATAARQTLRANDAGTALEWGHPVEVRDSGADQGDAYALNFVAGTNCNIAATVAAGVATITPSVDLSSVTYTAGDGIDLAGNQFSADVSDFAGTGLEDDGSNNLRIAAAAAGAGLTGGGGSALAVGAGTGITVNANDVQLSTIAAHSFLGNITGLAAAPTGNSLATLAGDYLTYNNAGGINWAGAGILDNSGAVLGTQGQILQGLDSATIEEAWAFSVDTAALRYNVRLDATFAWTGSHSWTGSGDFTVNTAGDFDVTAASVGLTSTSTLLLDSVGDMTLQSDGDLILRGDEVRVRSNGTGGFLTFDGASASTPGLATNEGMFWVVDPGSAPTRPRFTNDTNEDFHLVYAYDRVQDITGTSGGAGTIALNDEATVVRWAASGGAINVDGFSGILWDGRRILLRNANATGANTVTLNPEAAAATAANRMVGAGTGAATDASRTKILRSRGQMAIIYDAASSRWFLDAI